MEGLTGFRYDGADYYYRKNLQGDIIGIINAAGTELVSYSYDAWGNILWTEDDSEKNLGELNPFRYRGYYYDTETGLYYLNSRYYDPRTGRFINADEVEYLGEDAEFSCNLYAYCGNNPVMGIDPEGTFAITTMIILGLIAIGAVAGGTAAGITAYNEGARGWEVVGWTALGAVGGGAVGGLIGTFAAPIIAGSLGAGAMALAGGGILGAGTAMGLAVQTGLAIAGTVAGALLTSGALLFARTRRSNGYWGEKWPGDHDPDHFHLKGENGTNIRIDPEGNPLPGEPSLNHQQRKALHNLWEEILKKLFKL